MGLEAPLFEDVGMCKKVYVVCPLSGIPDRRERDRALEFRAKVVEVIEGSGYSFLDFVGRSTNAYAADTMRRDLLQVAQSDRLIALDLGPSDGKGYELCEAKWLGIPVLILIPEYRREAASAFTSGAGGYCPGMYTVRYYSSDEEAFRAIRDWL